jgi:hypothetical protein
MGIFDDLIPAEPQKSTTGLFDDLVPSAPTTPTTRRGRAEREPDPVMAAPAPAQPTTQPQRSRANMGNRNAAEATETSATATQSTPTRPVEANPPGLAATRAIQRGLLRTASTAPSIAAQFDAQALDDAGKTPDQISAEIFREITGQWPTRGMDISTPEATSATLQQMGFPASSVGTYRNLLELRTAAADRARAEPSRFTQRAVGNIMAADDLNARAASIKFSPAGQRMQTVFEETPDTFSDTALAILKNPVDFTAFIAETAAESLPQIGASAAIGALTRSPMVGLGTMAAGSASQEFGSSVNEFLQENGVRLETEEDARALLDNPDLMRAAAERGMGRSLVIAIAEATGQGLALRRIIDSPVGDAMVQTVLQGATGAGGEAAARAATGQEMSAREIMIEGLAELVTAPLEVGAAVASQRGSREEDRGGQTPPSEDRERRDSVLLTPADRASPIRNDIIDDGKQAIDQILRGEDPVIPQAAPSQPATPAGPSAAPSIDTADIPEGAVSLDTLFGDGDQDADVQIAQNVQNEQSEPATLEESAPVSEEVAQPPAEPQQTQAEPVDQPARGIEVVDNDVLQSLETDAETFQYKGGADADGVTDRLRDVRQWDSNRTGIALVYEYEDGRRVVVDGHQRVGLARRLAAEGQQIDLPIRVLRQADGISEADARRIGAEKNIAEGSGTAIDAAKIFRETRMTASQLNLPRNSSMVRTGEGMAQLSDVAFGMVLNNVASERDGALVGNLVKNEAQHENILGLLARMKPSNAVEAESMIRQAESMQVTETQTSLFGEEEVSANLMVERAKVIGRVISDLGREISTFKTLNTQGETITGAGNVLDEQSNQARLAQDETARATLLKQANTKGPISDALTTAARAVKDGTPVAKAARQFIDAFRGIQDGNDAGASTGRGPEAGGAGRGDGRADEGGQAPTAGQVENTPAGQQTVAPGIAPITDKDRLEAEQNRPKRGGDAPADDGLFDLGARDQDDMFSDPKPKTEPKAEAEKPASPLFDGERADNTSSLTLEEQDRLAALRAQFRDQMKNQMNSGLDPKMVSIAAEMGAIYIKAGARRFRDLLRAMMEDLGLTFAQAQPYARNAYNQARDDMDLNGESIEGMDTAAEVMAEVKAMRAELAEAKAPDTTNTPDPNPTDAQKQAGNYKMGHLSWNGLDISIETAKGQNRTGRDDGGREWSVKMPANYGYIKRTEGADGDHVDIYMGDMPDSDIVVIVNQIDLATGKFDEHKVVAGAGSTAAALRLYEAGFSDGKGKQRIGSFTVTGVDGFKAWLTAGDTSVPTEPIRPQSTSTTKSPKPEAGPGVVVLPADEVEILSSFGDDVFGIANTANTERVAIADKDGDWFLLFSGWRTVLSDETKTQAVVRMFNENRTELAPQDVDNLRRGFQGAFSDGKKFKTIVEARALVRDFIGYPYQTWMAKPLEEAIEAAVVLRARAIISEGKDKAPVEVYRDLVALYEAQPLLNQRTSTSVEMQAYSTPAPLAYIASRLADIGRTSKVYEPTAGNGMLLIEASPSNVQANEMQQSRVDALRTTTKGAKITQGDAMLHTPDPYDTFIANPPFGKVRDDTGKTQVFDLTGFDNTTTEIDHAIVMKGLAGLPDDGRAVLLIGGHQGNPDERRAAYTKQPRIFFKKLYDNFNVTEHFTADGKLYNRQGAGWPVDVIVIDGKGKSKKTYPMAQAPVVYDNWKDIGARLDGTDTLDTRTGGNGIGDGSDGPAQRPSDQASVSSATRRPDQPAGANGVDGSRSGASGAGGTGGSSGGNARPVDGGRSDGLGQRDSGGTVGDAGTDVAGANQQDPAASGTGNSGVRGNGQSGGISGDAVSRDAVVRDNTEAETSFQVQYTPRSQAVFAVGTLVPRNMQQAMSRALDALQARIANSFDTIDAYVADALGYSLDDMLGVPATKNTEAKNGYFSAEQVDALALAIDNVEKGKGFIVGDQTGVGKGRFVAAMLRYAERKGMVPVFITKDPGLFGDMVRDMRDIGMPDAHKSAFLTDVKIRNKGAIPLSQDPNDKLTAGTAKTISDGLNHMKTTGRLPDGSTMLFTSYSQLQQVRGQNTDRMAALMGIAPNAMFVLDESHEAGGQPAGDRDPNDGKVSRAEFIRKLLAESQAAVFSSATYAKNPAVMSLYAKTDLSLVTENIDQLADLVTAGGVPLQQVMANMLVESGQYARRERSFEGVSMALEQMVTDKTMANRGAEVMRTLFNLDVDVMQEAREKFIDEKTKEGMGGVNDLSVGDSGMTSTNFASTMHNVAAQFLLSIKVDAVVDQAIALVKAGEKPIIALSNTNASIMQDHAIDQGVGIGDAMNLPFNVILERYLERLRRITVKDDNDKKTYIRMSDADLREFGPPGALEAYQAAKAFIASSNLEGLPGSPIDHILDRLEAAGIAAGEITGRTITLGNKVLKKRDASPAAKKRTMNQFNSGELDALVINRSGSTGFSMHATAQPGNDGKKRHMIILQAEPNIDLFMQMLGRIHRTGQTQLPNYTIAVSDLAVEKRPAAVLMRKLASLNANTTASKKSAVSLDNVVDFLNPYGDAVVRDFVMQNVDLMMMLDISIGKEIDGLAAKFTGRLVSLPPDTVTAIYDQVEANYTDLIEALDRTGANALEAKTLELDAKTVNRTEIIPAKDEASPFGRAAYLENVDVKKIGRPYSPEQLQEEIDRVLDGKTQRAFVNDQIDTLRAKLPTSLAAIQKRKEAAIRRLAAATTDKQKDNAQDSINRAEAAAASARQDLLAIEAMLDTLAPGRVGQLTFASSASAEPKAYAAAVIGVDLSKMGETPSASAIRVKIAIADAGREISMPLSKLMSTEGGNSWREFPDAQRQSVMKAFSAGQSESREDRQMVTGNIPAGLKQFPTGRIVMYSDDKGNLRQGILLPSGKDASEELAKRPVVFKTATQVREFLSNERGSRVVQSEDNVLSISGISNGDYSILVNNTGAKKYILNKRIESLFGAWETRRGSTKGWKKIVDADALETILGIWADNIGTEYSTTIDRNAAREITGEVLPTIPGANEGLRMSRTTLPGTNVEVDTRYLQMHGGGYFMTELRPDFKKQADALNAEIRLELNKMGLPMIKTAAVNQIFQNEAGDTMLANGVYYKGMVIVSLALDADVDAKFIIRHEGIHALRSAELWGAEFGLFRPAEWRALEEAAKRDTARMADANRDYADQPIELRIEEVIANQYAAWAAGEMNTKGFVRVAFERIKDVIAAFRRALAGKGYTTRDDVFKNIARGEIGARADAIASRNGNNVMFARKRTPDQRETDRQASVMVGEDVTHGVTSRTPIEQRKDSFLKAIATQPLDQAMRIPFMIMGGLDERGRWRLGKAAHEKISKVVTEADSGFMAPLVERVRYGIIDRYGLPQDYIERDRQRGVDEALIATEGKEHLESLLAHKMTAQEATVLQAVLTGEAVPEAQMAKLSEPIRQAIDNLGAEAVELGLISAESFERNRGQYLHRVYAKNEIDTTAMGRWAQQLGAKRRQKIVGNQFKGRGIFEEVSAERIFKDNEEFLGAKRGKPQKGDKIIILDLRSTTGTDALPMVDGPKGRLRKRVYWPADKPIPAKLNNYESRGTFEVRGERSGRIVLWRDFDKAERMKMGEILDARYTIGKTYAMMAQDLATGRFFRDIATNEMWSRKEPPADARIDTEGERNGWLKRMWVDPAVEWVKVPDTKISKSDTFRYGALAGRYVRADIWRDMQELQSLQSPNFYQRLLTQWKLNKTARSPVVHMNNVMSNFILMDMADVRSPELLAGLTAMATKNELYREAQLAGAFGADQVTQELQDSVLRPLLDELRKDIAARPGGIEARVGFLSKAMDGIVKGIKATDGAMVNAYQMEDQVFRMATYIRRRQQGATVAEAAIEARDQFLNYDIRAPWINAARRSVLPFISYTYRAVPMVAKTIAERPWKVAKYIAIYQAINTLAYLVAPSDYDEEEERKSMRSNEQGKTWLGVERMVRMPYLQNGNPVFLDIRRWVPAGDVFDTQGGDLPAWLHIGGPIVIGMELYLNRSAFTDQDIVNRMTDSFGERAQKRLDFLWKSFAPNAPWIPNSWYQEQIMRAFQGEAVQWGSNQPYDPMETVLSSFGIKLKPKDVELGYLGWEIEFDRINRELSAQARALTRQRERGLINDETLDRNMQDLIKKRDRLRREMRETFPQ